jgi:hypothetical protein
MALAELEGQNQARVAEILAKGEAVQRMLSGLTAGSRAKVTTQLSGQATTTTVANHGGGGVAGSAVMVVADKCLRCHDAGNSQGRLALNDLSQLSADQAKSVLSRVIDQDPERRMPKEGALTLEEQIALFRGLGPVAAAER